MEPFFISAFREATIKVFDTVMAFWCFHLWCLVLIMKICFNRPNLMCCLQNQFKKAVVKLYPTSIEVLSNLLCNRYSAAYPSSTLQPTFIQPYSSLHPSTHPLSTLHPNFIQPLSNLYRCFISLLSNLYPAFIHHFSNLGPSTRPSSSRLSALCPAFLQPLYLPFIHPVCTFFQPICYPHFIFLPTFRPPLAHLLSNLYPAPIHPLSSIYPTSAHHFSNSLAALCRASIQLLYSIHPLSPCIQFFRPLYTLYPALHLRQPFTALCSPFI